MRTRLSVLLILATPFVAHAQFSSYPSFQVPRVAVREYNFAAADSPDAGTSLVFQWREGLTAKSHLSLDAGLEDPNQRGANARLILGGGYAQTMHPATDDLPLDLLLTAGLGGSFGGGSALLRIPVGVSVGHTFKLDGPITVTPYAHPRLSIDYCSHCGGAGRSDTNLGVDVDLGVGVELSRALELRASGLFAGSDFFGRDNAFGISLAWKVPGLR